MTDNVVGLHGGAVASERKQAFLDAVAQSFDYYVKSYGYEPEALVYIMNGLKLSSMIAWHIDGESKDGASSILSLAAVHVLSEAGTNRKDI